MSKLLKALREIRDIGPEDPTNGICIQPAIRGCYLATKFELRELIKRWPKYSGSEAYPVPAPTLPPIGSIAAQRAYIFTADKWDKDTAYGRLRWELLNWCIEELENEQKTA